MTTSLALPRLFQLISPSLPIGGYSYSQGIEWAVDAGWITDKDNLHEWVWGLMKTSMTYLELPVLFRMMEAWALKDKEALNHWNTYLLACRETLELRNEEMHRARAFFQLLRALKACDEQYQKQMIRTQHACFSYACVQWGLSYDQAGYGLIWSWMENLVLSAIKIIPLGQTAGQMVVFNLSERIPGIIENAQRIDDDAIGTSSMALAIASAQHENQYTRLFRS